MYISSKKREKSLSEDRLFFFTILGNFLDVEVRIIICRLIVRIIVSQLVCTLQIVVVVILIVIIGWSLVNLNINLHEVANLLSLERYCKEEVAIWLVDTHHEVGISEWVCSLNRLLQLQRQIIKTCN